MKKRTVEIIMAALTLGLVVLDIGLASDRRRGNTISEVVWSLLGRVPFVGFVAGFVCGHLFWQRAPDAAGPPGAG